MYRGAAIAVASDVITVTTDVVESDLTDIQVGQTASITLDLVGKTRTQSCVLDRTALSRMR